MDAAGEKREYTYADILSWDESVRAEIIDGELYMMAEPSRFHQEISGDIFRQLSTFLLGKKCKVYHPPFGVRLFEKRDAEGKPVPPERVKTVVEPDITVVCDHDKLDDRGCAGAPDLIIEILSPSTRRKDRRRKFRLYEQAGVREYWIVDPETRTVSVFQLEDGRYAAPDIYAGNGSVPVGVLDGFSVDLSTVFPPELNAS